MLQHERVATKVLRRAGLLIAVALTAACSDGASGDEVREDAIPSDLLQLDPSACTGKDGPMLIKCGPSLVGDGEATRYDLVTGTPCKISVKGGLLTVSAGKHSEQAQLDGEDADRLLTINGNQTANARTMKGVYDHIVNLTFNAQGQGPMSVDFTTPEASYTCITKEARAQIGQP